MKQNILVIISLMCVACGLLFVVSSQESLSINPAYPTDTLYLQTYKGYDLFYSTEAKCYYACLTNTEHTVADVAFNGSTLNGVKQAIDLSSQQQPTQPSNKVWLGIGLLCCGVALFGYSQKKNKGV